MRVDRQHAVVFSEAVDPERRDRDTPRILSSAIVPAQ
jgi:hypothetical protein